MRNLPLTRTEGEWLVDLLEKRDPEDGSWPFDLAEDIRALFGMCSREEEIRKILKSKGYEKN